MSTSATVTPSREVRSSTPLLVHSLQLHRCRRCSSQLIRVRIWHPAQRFHWWWENNSVIDASGLFADPTSGDHTLMPELSPTQPRISESLVVFPMPALSSSHRLPSRCTAGVRTLLLPPSSSLTVRIASPSAKASLTSFSLSSTTPDTPTLVSMSTLALRPEEHQPSGTCNCPNCQRHSSACCLCCCHLWRQTIRSVSTPPTTMSFAS